MSFVVDCSRVRFQSIRKRLLAGGFLVAVTTLSLVACSAPRATAAVAPPTPAQAAPAQPSTAGTNVPSGQSRPTAAVAPTREPVATSTAVPTIPPTSTPQPSPTPVPPPNVQTLTLTGASQTANGDPLVTAKDQPVLHWTLGTGEPGAVDHFLELADHQQTAPATVPTDGTTIPATSNSQPLGDLADGSWYVHLWPVGTAGQAGAPGTLAVQVLQTPPRLSNVLFRTWVTNPSYQTVPISFSVSQAARVSVLILPESSSDPLRSFSLGQKTADTPIKVEWDGKDAQGHVVAPGSYRFMIDAVDEAGNQTQSLYTGLSITDKVIKVSLSKQSMSAYAGSQVFATTLVTTGGQALPTHPGQYEILQKSSPFVFHAQFPKGSPYWFPDVTSHYAMLFDQPDADFIHDAPWRTVYGPGTNGPGIPGSTYTGSHGCVETPGATMTRLYDWTSLGTPVIVTP